MNFMHPKLSHSNSSEQGIFRRIAADPFVDWFLIFIIFFIMLCSFGAVGYKEYSSVTSIISGQASPVAQKDAVILDTKLMGGVLQDFDARAAERAGLLKGYSGPGDPSL